MSRTESKVRVHRPEVHNDEPGTRKNWTIHCCFFFLMFDNNVQTYFTYHSVTRLKCTLMEFSRICSYINLIAINFRASRHPQTFYPPNSKPSRYTVSSFSCSGQSHKQNSWLLELPSSTQNNCTVARSWVCAGVSCLVWPDTIPSRK